MSLVYETRKATLETTNLKTIMNILLRATQQCKQYCFCQAFGRGANIQNNVSLALIFYSETCVLWTPWDQQKVSRLSGCPDFPGQFI